MIAQLNHMAHIWWQWMSGMFWQVGLLILFVTLIDMAIRRWAWPQVRYVLWGLVFLKLVIPPTWQMPTSVVSWAQPLLEKHISIQVETEEIDSGVFLPSELDFLPADLNEDAVPGRQATWPTLLFLTWISGMVVFSLMLVRKLSGLRRWQRLQNELNASESKIPEWFHEHLIETSKRLKLKKIPTIVFSREAVGPAVFGILRPTLLLPEGYLSGLSREEAEHVLIHELCHLKRGDLWVHWLCLLIQIVYWFNPLLIWSRRQMRHVCEICCDLSVAEVLRDKTRDYRETLLKNARELFTETVEPSMGFLGLFEEPFRIVPRLRWLERETWGHRKSKFASALATCLVMVVFVMPMAGFSQSGPQGSEVQLKSLPASPSPDVPISGAAKAALVEANHRLEADPTDFASARQPLIEFLESHPQDSVPSVVYHTLGKFWLYEGIPEEANEVFAMASALFPGNEQLLHAHAQTTFDLGQFEEAALLFETYYNVFQNREPDYLERAAGAYYNAGNMGDAKRVFSQLIDLTEPPEQRFFDLIINICRQMEDPDEAEKYIRQAMDYFPTAEGYSMHLANIYFEKGDYQAGNAILEEAGLPLRSTAETAEATQSNDLPNEDRVYQLREVDIKPRVTSPFPPKYPYEAKLNNITGRVVTGFVVTKEGLPRDEWIVEAEPPDVFEESALEAIRQYRFTPGIRNGEPVEVRVRLPIAFELGLPAPNEDVPEKSDDSGIFGTAYDLAEVDTKPRVLRAFPPQYPFVVKTKNIEGRVVLRFVVDTDGKAKEPEMVEAVPEEASIFEESALMAVEQYEFEPATLNGEPVTCIVKMPIVFELD